MSKQSIIMIVQKKYDLNAFKSMVDERNNMFTNHKATELYLLSIVSVSL